MKIIATTVRRFVKEHILTDLDWPIFAESGDLISGAIYQGDQSGVSIFVKTRPVQFRGEALLQLVLSDSDLVQLEYAIKAARLACSGATAR